MKWAVLFLLGVVAALSAAQNGPAFESGVHGGRKNKHGNHGHKRTGHGVAAQATTKNVAVSEKQLDGHVDDLVWATKDGSTMFLLSSAKTLYRSVDGGKTWADQMESLKHLHASKFSDHLPQGTTLRGVTGIIKSEHVMLFLGEEGMHVLTKDHGKTYVPLWHPHKLSEFKLHPSQPNLLLASTLTPRCYTADADGLCYKNLLYSSDFGDSWKVLQEFVVQYEWTRSMKTHAQDYPQDAIFATLHNSEQMHENGHHQVFGKWDNRVDFVVSKDLFVTHELLVPRGNRFLFTERYLAVAAVAADESEEGGSSRLDKYGYRHSSNRRHYAVASSSTGAATNHIVSLVLSSDGGHRWHTAELEYPLMSQHSYTILDTSNDAIFLHVNHNGEGAKWGNVYLSNAIGTNFSLSLPHNRRDANGKCDFEKLTSMEGVYIANYYENTQQLEMYQHHKDEASMGQDISGRTDHGYEANHEFEEDGAGTAPPDPEIRTVMTFDRGASWEYLQPPSFDALGNKIECHSNDHPMDGSYQLSVSGDHQAKHCSLHLHGVTDVFGPFYSSPNAVGLMMATGNVGAELTFREGLVNTYFSRDGGHEWFEVAKGSHIYEFGDHGGIIVMANDEAEVNEVLYSFNEGLTWESLKFTNLPVLVDNIMIEPKGASERFVLYGTRIDPSSPESNNRVGVVFTLDFSQLHTRACTGEDSAGTENSDYERWAPSATAKGDSCLMGRRVEYTRRKRDRACYNSDDIEIAHFVNNCECTDRDWECDRGYKRFPIDGGVCVRDPEVPIDLAHLVPHYCRPGLHYHVSNGYRKVAGDSCTGGVQHEMSLLPCPGSSWHHSVSHGGWAVMMLLIGLCGSLAAVTYCQFASASSRGGYGSGKAGFLNGKGRPATPTFSSLPAAVAKPLAIVVGVTIATMHVAASTAYHGFTFVVDAVKCNKKNSAYGSGASNIGGGSGFSSRGFGIPAFSGTAGSGATYNQMGKERVDTADFDDDDDTAANNDEETSAGRRRKVGGSFKDNDEGDDDDDDGGDDDGDKEKEGDLLGLGDPLTSSGGLGGGDVAIGTASRSSSTPGAKVPTLRPPRSHEGKKA